MPDNILPQKFGSRNFKSSSSSFRRLAARRRRLAGFAVSGFPLSGDGHFGFGLAGCGSSVNRRLFGFISESFDLFAITGNMQIAKLKLDSRMSPLRSPNCSEPLRSLRWYRDVARGMTY
jgi:hypothetical protein